MSFDELGLTPELLHAVADQGYTEPTPVQAATIPLVLAGRDVRAAAQTGTGKTAAFVLPIIQTLHATRRPVSAPPPGAAPRRTPVRVLILVPTRELALQVEESVRVYGARKPVRSTTIYGGVGFDAQARELRAGVEIVVATPGRLLDHVEQRTIDLSRVEVLVLDEADRMLDMGFIRDIRKILALLPPRRQNLLFSATFSDEMRELANRLLTDPASVEVARRNTAAELVRQVVHPVDRERKRELLSRLIRSGQIRQALVFTRTKHGANRLAEQLVKDGIAATAIHGNKSQPQRVKALNDFKAGRADIMVATDIAARGLDIDALPHVVNYELPMVAQDYVHRIGRTGRAGSDGIAISLVCVDEAKLLREIEILLGRGIETEAVPGFTPDRTIRPEPVRLRSTPAERAERASERARAGGAGPSRGAGAGASRGAGPSRAAGPSRGAGERSGTGIGRPMPNSRIGRPMPSAGIGRPMSGTRPLAPLADRRQPGDAQSPAVGQAQDGRSQAGRREAGRPGATGGRRPAGGRGNGGRGAAGRVTSGRVTSGASIGQPQAAARPPWARDAGRVNGERVSAGGLRALPGERLSRLAGE